MASANAYDAWFEERRSGRISSFEEPLEPVEGGDGIFFPRLAAGKTEPIRWRLQH